MEEKLNLQNIPRDVLPYIGSFFDHPADILSLALTCKRFSTILFETVPITEEYDAITPTSSTFFVGRRLRHNWPGILTTMILCYYSWSKNEDRFTTNLLLPNGNIYGEIKQYKLSWKAREHYKDIILPDFGDDECSSEEEEDDLEEEADEQKLEDKKERAAQMEDDERDYLEDEDAQREFEEMCEMRRKKATHNEAGTHSS